MSNYIGRCESQPVRNKGLKETCKFHSLEPNIQKTVHNDTHEIFKEQSISWKRKKILNEIYETEKTYQYHLMLLTTLFLYPVKVSSVLPTKIVDGIFSNIEAIQSVSSHLLELMEEEGVVHGLLQLAPYMKLYSLYANNFDNSNKLLEDWQKKSGDFARLLKFQESREEMQSLKLIALLIAPIQRVPRYRLLLENLLQKTYEGDPDFPKLKDAFDTITTVTSHINECVRQHENFHKMLAIQNSFTGRSAPKILAPSRLFIREGSVTKITDHGGAKERMLLLFNDMIVCAKKETSCTYRCCDVYPLVSCIVEQLMGNSNTGNGLFKVICKEKSLLLCSKLEDNSWADDIKNAISELHSNLASLRRGDHTPLCPIWQDVPDTKSKIRPRSPFKKLVTSSQQPPQKLRKVMFPNVASHALGKENVFIIDRIASLPHRNSKNVDVNHKLSFTNDMFYGMSSVNSGNRSDIIVGATDDEVFKDNRTYSVNSTKQINWTVSESTPVESRRPLHSLAASAKSFSGKIGCTSVKRKCCPGNSRALCAYTKENYSLQEKQKQESTALLPASGTDRRGLNDIATGNATDNCRIM